MTRDYLLGHRCRVRDIIAEECLLTGFSYAQMVGPEKWRDLAWARQKAYWRARNETTASLPAIGRAFGGRDHQTVWWGIRQHERRMRGESCAVKEFKAKALREAENRV